jgi:SHS2 domain-containing protein
MLVAPGAGVVPAQPLWSAACKRAVEIVSDGVKHVHTSGDPALALGFTAAGHSAERVRAFLHEALAAGRRIEPMVESGNKYGVCARFHDVNAALVAEALRESDLCLGLSARDRARALRIFDVVFGHPEMRNRNVLHAGVLDSCVIGNLLNFPKHVFGFPFGSHATDGNEALSLCLYGYRQLWEAAEEARLGAERAAAGEGRVPVILYVRGSGCGGGSSSSSSGSSSAKDDGGAAKSANDDAVEADALVNLRRCAARLGMALDTCASVADARLQGLGRRRVAVVMAGLHHPDLDGLAKAARDVAANLHVHVLAHEWRAFFAAHASPVHMKVPEGVRSISIEEGLFCSGFAVYRDVTLRDMHLDVGYGWQAAYMSPNEGGSGASTPLFLDFCITMLGWSAIADLAKGGGGGTMLARERTTQTTAASTLGTASTHCRSLCPTLVPPFSSESYGRDHKEWKAGLSDGVFADMVSKTPPQVLKWDKPAATSPVIEWGTSCISGRRNACGGAADQTDWGQALAKTVSSTSSSAAAAAAAAAADVSPSSKTVNPEERIGRRLTRANLEALLVHFQREFLGGKERALEVFSTGGGTRSINLAFEAVIANHKRYCDAHTSKKPLRRRIKVITGNPHLAVERAERRFRFELIRMPREGALCPTKLKQAITDLDVVAIYTQTLSYTDGITDPLEEILDVVESENQRRAALSPPALPVTLINDCCLAFSVLVHNDGKEGRPSMRVLDLSRGCVTPILVTLDAHKHIGSDKGISTVIGTSGTLSVLKGKVKVGAQVSFSCGCMERRGLCGTVIFCNADPSSFLHSHMYLKLNPH